MSYTNLLYHIVFGTKRRQRLIIPEIEDRFHAYMGGIVRGLGCTALEINGMEDHVHLLAKIKPSICISDFLRDLKSNSSVWAKQNGMQRFAWQRRYGAFTVSESQREIVRRYIQNQKQHHKKFNFKVEFESLLLSNGIPIDEYVWQE